MPGKPCIPGLPAGPRWPGRWKGCSQSQHPAPRPTPMLRSPRPSVLWGEIVTEVSLAEHTREGGACGPWSGGPSPLLAAPSAQGHQNARPEVPAGGCPRGTVLAQGPCDHIQDPVAQTLPLPQEWLCQPPGHRIPAVLPLAVPLRPGGTEEGLRGVPLPHVRGVVTDSGGPAVMCSEGHTVSPGAPCSPFCPGTPVGPGKVLGSPRSPLSPAGPGKPGSPGMSAPAGTQGQR